MKINYTEQDKRIILKKYNQLIYAGYSTNVSRKRCGVSGDSIQKWAKELGIELVKKTTKRL